MRLQATEVRLNEHGNPPASADEMTGPRPDPRHRLGGPRRGGKIVTVLAVIVLLGAMFSVAVSYNAFGQNVSGMVECGDGRAVSGVFVEAKRLSRIGSMEVQSGWAQWGPGDVPSRAAYQYWLPVGGEFSLHFGCGLLEDGVTWVSDNRTPFVAGDGQSWVCNGTPSTGTVTVVVPDSGCRKMP